MPCLAGMLRFAGRLAEQEGQHGHVLVLPRFDFELIHRVDRVGDRVGGVADRYRRLFSIPPSLSEGLQGWGLKILCQGAGVLQIHCL